MPHFHCRIKQAGKGKCEWHKLPIDAKKMDKRQQELTGSFKSSLPVTNWYLFHRLNILPNTSITFSFIFLFSWTLSSLDIAK